MGLASGLSRKETMLSTPGEVYDLFDLYLLANGYKKARPDE